MEIAETYSFPLGFQMTDAYYLIINSIISIINSNSKFKLSLSKHVWKNIT